MGSRMAVAPAMKIVGNRLFSMVAISRPAVSGFTNHAILYGSARPVFGPRFMATAAVSAQDAGEAEKLAGGKKEDKAVMSYWGVEHKKVMKEDGSEWKWACFRPCDTYSSDLSIDLGKHHLPVTWMDKLAQWTVKTLRWPTDIFFQEILLRRRC